MSTKRKLLVCALWAIVAGLTLIAAGLQNPFTGLFLLLCVFAACALGGIYAAVKVWGKHLLTIILVATMATLPVLAQPTNSVPVPQPDKPQAMPPPQCNPIIGGMILAIGVAVVWGIYKLCKKLDKMMPPPTPPTPVPPPPPNVRTNTNAAPHIMLIAVQPQANWNIQFGDISSNVFDIGDGQFPSPDGSIYTNLLSVRVDCSTNLYDWSRYCSVTQWCAMSGYSLTVLYDCQGKPLYAVTNNANQPLIPDFSGCLVPTNDCLFLRAVMAGN